MRFGIESDGVEIERLRIEQQVVVLEGFRQRVALHGIEPEVIDYRTMKVEYPGYQLRPEIVESTYYLHHYTHDPKYLAMGQKLFEDFVKHDRAPHGYAALDSVVTMKQRDAMESYALAETFKYYFLLFDPKALDFDAITFNTEAHPLRRTWQK